MRGTEGKARRCILKEGKGSADFILERRCRDKGTDGKGAVMRGRKGKRRCRYEETEERGNMGCRYRGNFEKPRKGVGMRCRRRYKATQKREIECRCRGDLIKVGGVFVGGEGKCGEGVERTLEREKGCREEGTKRRGKRCEYERYLKREEGAGSNVG
jgi:hypothetical protein